MNLTSIDIFVLAAPVLATGHMWYLLTKRKRIRRKGHTATGEVVGIEGSGEDAYPIIRFTTLTGDTIEKKYKVGQTKKMAIGDKLPVYYDPDKPANFFVDRAWEERLVILFMASGVIFTVCYFLFFRQTK